MTMILNFYAAIPAGCQILIETREQRAGGGAAPVYELQAAQSAINPKFYTYSSFSSAITILISVLHNSCKKKKVAMKRIKSKVLQ
jgi:hypothetical protein